MLGTVLGMSKKYYLGFNTNVLVLFILVLSDRRFSKVAQIGREIY